MPIDPILQEKALSENDILLVYHNYLKNLQAKRKGKLRFYTEVPIKLPDTNKQRRIDAVRIYGTNKNPNSFGAEIIEIKGLKRNAVKNGLNQLEENFDYLNKIGIFPKHPGLKKYSFTWCKLRLVLPQSCLGDNIEARIGLKEKGIGLGEIYYDKDKREMNCIEFPDPEKKQLYKWQKTQKRMQEIKQQL